MVKTISTYYKQHPLRTILFAGLFIRLLAVVFSKGFGWIDDQFLIVEIAQSWVDGTDYYGWLPDVNSINKPKGFSFFYVGLHYLIFKFLELIKITDAQSKMYIIRLLHALWSLLIISGGYKIVKKVGDEHSAKLTGWLLAVLWLFPFLSVRNLVEYVSIPLIVFAIYQIITPPNKSLRWHWLWIGILLGIAFNIRYQTMIFTGGVGLVLLFQKKWKETFLVATGIIVTIIVFQGILDYLVWDQPFIQLQGYINYNIHHANDYLTAPWYFYILVILGLLIPPISFYLAIGFFKSWKRVIIIFIPTFIFLIFHSIFPNKQERFIITILPFIIMGGVIGWHQITSNLDKKTGLKQWHRGSWIFFWIINFILLLPVSTMYSKKARVEAMEYLSQYEDLTYFMIDDVNKTSLRPPPMFYLENWVYYDPIMKNADLEEFRHATKWKRPENQPGFILFMESKNIESRVRFMQSVFPGLEFETLIEPGIMDRLLHWLNPINDNQNIFIYRNSAVYPNKLNDE
ncbi:MAG: glycosyltransferase family 39 protein [Bacteroidetes bacterium]|nr:glycosyltransferase family 39 protein [Bacteroidota bacterium]